MIKYKNTRGVTVRLKTSNGVVILRGFDTIELNEDVHHPYFVEKSTVREKAAPKAAAPKATAPKKSVPAPKETKTAKKE